MRRAKIVATLGPASEREEVLERLIRAGMNIVRLNFSHGTQAEHAARIATVRKVARQLGTTVGILQDLQGPKVRVGNLPQPIHLVEGELIHLYVNGDSPPSDSKVCIPIDFAALFTSVQPDHRILLDDGRLSLSVLAVSERLLTARVVVGGRLTAHKGINLPGVRLNVPGFTDKDEADLIFGLEQEVDAVAISFVCSAHDIQQVKQVIARRASTSNRPLIIAKLERPEALENLESILEVADGVMVARGDLGVEMPPERVPVLQKHIIHSANSRAKLVITATQMLESMIRNPLPTRAEASDVANAIFDGTDAVMLSGETAIGNYPVDTVQMMDRIVSEAEAHFGEWGTERGKITLDESDASSTVLAASELAHDRDVAAVAVFTMQGHTGCLMSKVRPRVPILAFTPLQETCRRLAFLWGVQPQLVPFASTLEEMIRHVDITMIEKRLIQTGQQVVLVCGFPVGAMRPPNMVLLHTVGE